MIKKDWWLAYLLACWDTGHPQDLRLLKRDELSPDGLIYRFRHKTGKVIESKLSQATLESIEKIRDDGDLVFPRWCNCCNHKCISEEFKLIADGSGNPGYIKYFRSGAGTAVELDNPNRGHEFLSNTRRTFEDNYLVRPHLNGRNVLSPTPLFERTIEQMDNLERLGFNVVSNGIFLKKNVVVSKHAIHFFDNEVNAAISAERDRQLDAGELTDAEEDALPEIAGHTVSVGIDDNHEAIIAGLSAVFAE